MEELKSIMKKFAESGWDLIAVPARQWLDGKQMDRDVLVSANIWRMWLRLMAYRCQMCPGW